MAIETERLLLARLVAQSAGRGPKVVEGIRLLSVAAAQLARLQRWVGRTEEWGVLLGRGGGGRWEGRRGE